METEWGLFIIFTIIIISHHHHCQPLLNHCRSKAFSLRLLTTPPIRAFRSALPIGLISTLYLILGSIFYSRVRILVTSHYSCIDYSVHNIARSAPFHLRNGSKNMFQLHFVPRSMSLFFFLHALCPTVFSQFLTKLF